MKRILIYGLAVSFGALLAMNDARSQVRCWLAYVAPESYTTQCANGYWITHMADGTVVEGNGISDPNARATGSTLGINPATGGPSLKGDATVLPPAQLPMDAPHQAPMWGNQPLQTR